MLVGMYWPSKKKVVVDTESRTVSGSEIPSVESPEFGIWLETPGNIERLTA